ncbi:TRAP transporter small permease [Pseudooceanicola sp. CBS1P-1]|uniref:TRAP transporter small permease protein n=1 Tax=Pseudooceanicola albus TaxID=2692189 RepID=A0A6L7G2Q9_9RHOB|nr:MULTISPECIES: TRAP transporter small permease subunit [Pseudooceanicola]MBT9385053.1 TRAP transporter small permease [Pseudooceanicola endophyticus]MXN18654.1 TRAP transporter small permease subunit [Pseudooceanicola albus]
MLNLLETAIARLSMVLGALVLLAMMLQVVIDVFTRTFLGAGFPATPDLVGKYYMVAVSVLPLALTELKRRHIEATVFTHNLRGVPLRVVQMLGFGIFTAVLAVMTWGSGQEAIRQMSRGAYIEAGTLKFITWPSYWILPISFALALVVLLIRIFETLTGRFGDHDDDPVGALEDMQEEI